MSTTTTTLTVDRLAAELPAMADAIHSTAVNKGWWAKGADRDQHEMIALQVSEVSEGLEEDREGRPPVWYKHPADCTEPLQPGICDCNQKPEGAAVELADCAIRCMDHLAFLMPGLLAHEPFLDLALTRARHQLANRASFGGKKMIVVGYLVDADRTLDDLPTIAADHLLRALVGSLAFAEELGVDPIEVCKTKMAYNGTRPFMHGGKAY